MNFTRSSAVLFLAIWLVAVPALANFYPQPGSVSEPPVTCDGCNGENPYGQPNDGLKTWPYDTPIAEHVGRLLDSTGTLANASLSFHTLRARTVRIASSSRGSAPPRLYMILGDVLTGWTLSDFVGDASETMSSVTTLKKRLNMSHSVFRSTAEVFNGAFDGMFYPLSLNHVWSVPGLGDLNDNTLADFDFDDRGYLYAAYSGFGYGILRDNGSGFFPLVKQMTDGSPSMTFALKVDEGERYAAIGTRQLLALYDVSTPSAPTFERDMTPVWAWAKNYDYSDDRPLIAVISSDGKTVKVYTEENLAKGGSPEPGASFTATTGRSFQDLAFDDEGRLWVVEGSAAAKVAAASLVQIRQDGSTWKREDSPFPRNVFPRNVAAAGDYVAVQGAVGSAGREDLFLFKVTGNVPASVDTGSFFQKFYHYPDEDYAQPYKYFGQSEVALLKEGSNVYMVYNALGLSDVYRLGTSVAPVCDAPAAVDFTYSGPAGCTTGADCPEDKAISFSATKNGAPLQSCDTVTWEWGDSTANDTSKTPTHIFNSPATYNVKLTVTSTSGTLSKTKPVKIVAPPCDPIAAGSINFTWDGPGACSPGNDCPAGGAISFSGTRGGGAFQICDTFAWDFDNNGTTDSTSETPTKSFSAPGTYPVKLTVDNTAGGPVSKTLDVVVIESTGCTTAPNKINFVPTYRGLESGCRNSNSTKCKRNETIEFGVSYLGAQACDLFEWTFEGTAEKKAGRNVTHSFTGTASSYDATLRVYNEAGEDEETITIPMEGGSSTTCTAPTGITFTYTGNKGCSATKNCEVGEQITFTPKRGSGSLQECDSAAWTFGDGKTSTSKTAAKNTFGSTGNFVVQLTVDNDQGAPDSESKTLEIVPATSTGGCETSAQDFNLSLNYKGLTSGCRNTNDTKCQPGETIEFGVSVTGYSIQSCDLWEWDFGGGSKATTRDATHVFASGASSYPVSVRLYNNSGEGKKTINLPMTGAAVIEVPVLSLQSFPATGVKGKTVSFTATSSLPGTTGWTWSFGDQTSNDISQAGLTQQSSTVTHTFNKTGRFTVKVQARNVAELPTILNAQISSQITISDVKETQFLIPVVSHVGDNAAPVKWRTDVQIYNPDTTVTPSNPLILKVKFGAVEYQLGITKSTHIYEDFLYYLVGATGGCPNNACAGPVIITTSATQLPQIWSRTYVQTDTGTYGQFIPAVRLDQTGGASAASDARYYLAGLRSDPQFRTNIGLVNPTVETVNATIRFYDGRTRIYEETKALQPFVFTQFGVAASGDPSKVIVVPGLPADRPFTVQVEVPAGKWVFAYASLIDNKTNDPIFVGAVKETELTSPDYGTIIVPGVSHTGQWRSDLTIFNPDAENVQVDIEYFDLTGAKKAEALSVPVERMLQVSGILKQGLLGAVPDGSGFLRLKLKTTGTATYPFAMVRTYYDTIVGGTYGQGIAGFPSARPNVQTGKPALIPAVRGGAFYKTNLFLVNLGETATKVRVSVLDPNSGAVVSAPEYDVAPFQTIPHINFLTAMGLTLEQATLKVEIMSGSTGAVWAYASVIDAQTSDPEYVQAFPLSQ